jgi:hypothetical protein
MKPNIKNAVAIMVMVILGIAAGASYVSAGHAWGCYAFGSPNIGYTNPQPKAKPGGGGGGREADYVDAFNGAVALWDKTVINLSSGNDIDMYYGGYGNNGWLGLAQIWPSGCTISRA